MTDLKRAVIGDLLQKKGGVYSRNLGIDLQSRKPGEIFRWFLASILFGARISETIASNTFQTFRRKGVDTPEGILRIGWNGLVRVLDEGGYARYDFKTATKLLETVQSLQKEYRGDLNRLHGLAADSRDLENRLQKLAKGIGPVTVNIFLREMRGAWRKADPLPGEACVIGAWRYGFFPGHMKSREKILVELKALWKYHRVPGFDFADFEAALVREGMGERRKKGKKEAG